METEELLQIAATQASDLMLADGDVESKLAMAFIKGFGVGANTATSTMQAEFAVLKARVLPNREG